MVSKESFGVSVLFPFSFDAWQTEIQSTFIFFFFFYNLFSAARRSESQNETESDVIRRIHISFL